MDADGAMQKKRSEKYRKRLSLLLLHEVKLARDQHGLKHQDYGRYRNYLSKRLRRLYKTLGMHHGKGKKFVARPINARSIRNDVRGLLVPLMSAERCWAAAMDMKHRQEQEGEEDLGEDGSGALGSGAHGNRGQNKRKNSKKKKNSSAVAQTKEDKARESRLRVRAARKKFVLRKLKRAAQFASNLHRVTARRCGIVSGLEAEAYSSWIQGTLAMEKEGKEADWGHALELLTKARAVYDNLSKMSQEKTTTAGMYAEYRDGLEPHIRFCQYKLGGNRGESLESPQAIAESDSGLQAKLAKVLAQARNEAAEGVRELMWHGRSLTVEGQAVRICLHSAKDVEEKIEACAPKTLAGAPEQEEMMNMYDALFVHLNDAKEQIKQQRAAAAKADGTNADVLSMLELAVSENVCRHKIKRTKIMIETLKARVDAYISQVSMGHTAGGSGDDKIERDRAARPDDLVRLYENMQQSIEDLGELAEGSQIMEDAGVLQDCVAMRVCVQAHRCFYIGMSYLLSEKFAEAYVLVNRASEYVEEAEGRVDALVDTSKKLELRDELTNLLLSGVSMQQCLIKVRAHANVIDTDAQLRGDIDLMSLEGSLAADECLPESALSPKRFSNYRSALVFKGSDMSKLPRLADLPPSLISLQGRAITLDTAINDIPEPAVAGEQAVEDADAMNEEDDVDEEDSDAKTPTGGFMSSLFGWSN